MVSADWVPIKASVFLTRLVKVHVIPTLATEDLKGTEDVTLNVLKSTVWTCSITNQVAIVLIATAVSTKVSFIWTTTTIYIHGHSLTLWPIHLVLNTSDIKQ